MALTFDNADIGQWLGGLFSYLVQDRAERAALDENLSGEDWKRRKSELLSQAFEDVAQSFPEPLRAKLRGWRDEFVSTQMRLN